MLALINDILDLSKIEAGQMEFEWIRCRPHQLLAEVASVLRSKALEKGLMFECVSHGPVPETIRSDPARLRQLIFNLGTNAVKFTAQGSVRLAMRLDRKGPKPQLVLIVSDTGPGIPPDKLEAIFLPFVQADSSVTRKHGGTGLGLPISREIARGLGGDLIVESELGGGSTFTVTVDTGPLDGVQMIEQGTPEAVIRRKHVDGTPTATPTTLPPVEILVVEDGATNRKLISLFLERAGARVTTAENGQEAVDLVDQRKFDLILMDIQMPVMDGYTATARLRQQGLTLPIIALTAHAMKGDDQKCRDAGCSGYLPKPIDFDQLLRTVSAALLGHASQISSPDALPFNRLNR
ncbi:MAG: response regulator [Pirellulales bacterium]|nr:response regulator [Pirellulales bacterium]